MFKVVTKNIEHQLVISWSCPQCYEVLAINFVWRSSTSRSATSDFLVNLDPMTRIYSMTFL